MLTSVPPPPQLAGVTLINSEMPQAIRGHRISGIAPHLASPRQRAHPPPPKGLPFSNPLITSFSPWAEKVVANFITHLTHCFCLFMTKR